MMKLTNEEQEILLGREVEELLTDEDRRSFAGTVCFITGAGGTVGGELARQIAACAPKRLVLIDNSEYALFRIEQSIRDSHPEVMVEPTLCDITRSSSVQRLMRRFAPDIVFHAAAYKHVTMAERDICATARVNVLGTGVVLAAARQVGARFVLISTDKAAAPHSVMGATKRLAEMVTLDTDDDTMRPIVVRFGNVLASSGSFVEVMRERIRAGKPLLVTDPDATRFFMTVSEAASLVMKATALSRGGETFWLDMGPQVRIGDLADRLLQAAASQGLPPVPVEVVGLRPGEKMVEQLAAQGIGLERTPHPRVFVAHQALARTTMAGTWIGALRRAISRDDAYGVMTTLTVVVRDFVPSEQAWAVAKDARLQAVNTARSARASRTTIRRVPRVEPAASARIHHGTFGAATSPRPATAMAAAAILPMRPKTAHAR
jgi:FlaA1/EpsC-like NDP-sugar epimerase